MNRRLSMKYSFVALVLAAFVTTASAQTAEFYVVQDTQTKKCTIVEKKPTTQTTVVVGDGAVYKTRTEAETAMKTVKVCTTN
jgi:vancomycin permeability regulator SanA